MSVVKKLAFAAIALAVMTGCASTPAPKDTQLQVTNPRASLAGSLVSLAGYPGLIPDNSYAPNMDAAINAGTMATLLPGDLGISSLSAASIGFALTSLEGTFPMDDGAAFIILQPINDASQLNDPAFIASTVKSSVNIAEVTQKLIDFDAAYADMLKQAKMDSLSCKPRGTSLLTLAGKGNFNYDCALPPMRHDVAIRAAGVYQGSDFDVLMPDVKAKKYAVLFLWSTDIKAKDGAQNVFKYERGTLSNSIAVLPFVSANSQGKHLVYLNGKATLI